MKIARARAITAAGWLLAAPLLLGADMAAHRFHRPIEGATGWTEFEIPDDVLDAARPGLADLRIVSGAGEEIPYAIGGRPAQTPVKLTLFDFERASDETIALVDRGVGPPRADDVEIDVTDREFIKPVTLEASADRSAWRQIARGTIFAAASGGRMVRLHFAPNDRRYWRFRFDDRNGPPIQVSGVLAGFSPERDAPRVAELELKAEPDTNLAASAYSTVLPSGNLRLRALRIHATDPAFVRRVRVFERIWFRDEISRRLLGEGDIARSAAGDDQTTLPLSDPTGKHLEIEIDRSGGLALHGVSAEAVIEPQTIRFHAPESAALELTYGSNAGAAPSYDLAAALRGGAPATFARAKLGPVSDTGREESALPQVTRGAPISTAGWKIEQPIVLPANGSIAYLDVDRGAGPLHDLRIVDRNRAQVPYIVEAEPRRVRSSIPFSVEAVSGMTRVRLDGMERRAPIEALEIEISSPEYFDRHVQVVEEPFDSRGRTEPRILGSARYVRAVDRPAKPLRIPVAQPSGSEVTIQIDDGDNAPAVVAAVFAEKSRRRLNFVFAPGDELRLLSDNDAAGAPRYDLALVATRVLSSPAEPATLGEARNLAVPRPPAPPWFWIFVLAAAVILLIALGRTLTQPARKAG